MDTENRLNDLADRDREWGPFLFLRPKKHEPIGALRTLSLSILIGGFLGMLANVLVALVAHSLEKQFPPVYVIPAVLIALYFGIFRFTVAQAWNRRAQRLTNVKAFLQRDEDAPS